MSSWVSGMQPFSSTHSPDCTHLEDFSLSFKRDAVTGKREERGWMFSIVPKLVRGGIFSCPNYWAGVPMHYLLHAELVTASWRIGKRKVVVDVRLQCGILAWRFYNNLEKHCQ